MRKHHRTRCLIFDTFGSPTFHLGLAHIAGVFDMLRKIVCPYASNEGTPFSCHRLSQEDSGVEMTYRIPRMGGVQQNICSKNYKQGLATLACQRDVHFSDNGCKAPKKYMVDIVTLLSMPTAF